MSSIKREIGHVHVEVVQKRTKKCTKKRVVLLIKTYGFFFFYLLVAVRVFGSLKVANDAGSRAAPTTWYNGGDVYD